jgi:hypothetical protein
MPETVDDRIIANRALARIGASPLGALDEETPKARQVRAIYPDVIEPLLALYDWSFARRTYPLDAVAAIADNGYDASAKKFMTGWRYAFLLPGTRLGTALKVLTDPRNPKDPLRDFQVENNTLYAERTPLWATVTVKVDPQYWLPAFRAAAVIGVAAALATPIAHDKALAKDLQVQFEGTPEEGGRGGLVGKAIAQDTAGAPRSAPMWRDPLTDARLS